MQSRARPSSARLWPALWATLMGLAPLAGSGCGAAPAGEPLDLTTLLPYAEVETETRRIDFGTPQARPHLAEGWSFDETSSSGRPFVWALGSRSLLRLYVAEPRDLELRFRCWPLRYPGAPQQRLTIGLAGRPLGEVALRARPQGYSLRVPAAALRPGENLLELEYARYVAPRDVLPGASDARPLALAWQTLEVPGARAAARPEVGREAGRSILRLPFGATLVFHLAVAAGSQLRFEGLRSWTADGAPPPRARLDVELREAGEPEGRWQAFAAPAGRGELAPLPLPGSPQRPLRVALRATPLEAGSSEDAGLEVVSPALVAAAEAPRLPAAPQQPPNVVIYMIDTLRSDRVGVYGHPEPTTPRIDAFARDATLFRRAIAQAPWTRPAVASVFTGLNPQRHGVRGRDSRLPATVPVLAELMRTHGYRTVAVVTNGNVSEGFGFDRGFDEFHYLQHGEPAELHVLSDRVNEVAFEWLEQQPRSQPFLLYLHTTDPHTPYAPRQPYRQRFAPDVSDGAVGTLEHLRAVTKRQPPDPAEARQLSALYDAEVAFNDAQFGALLDRLHELDLYDASLIVLLSDHGEAFLEHGTWQHGTTLYTEEIEVPLLIKLPDGRGRGRQVAETVRQIDVLPTLLDFVGATPPPDLDGRSLLAAIDGSASTAPVAAFSHLGRGRGEWRGVVYGEHKLIHTRLYDGRDQRWWLFDLHADPRERSSVVWEQPVWRGFLQSQLRRLEADAGPEASGPATLTPEVRRQLEALGYL
jgi:arylsulfatase A-like enzyme